MAGQTITATWTVRGLPSGTRVRVSLAQGRRSPRTISEAATAGLGHLAFAIPADVAAGNYAVVVSTLDRAVEGRSGAFRIEPQGTLSFTVTTPNEGDHWALGEARTIRWRTLGDYAGVMVVRLVRKDAGAPDLVIGRSANGGRFNWAVAKPAAGWGTYRIQVAPEDPSVRATVVPSDWFDLALSPHRILSAKVLQPRWLGDEASVRIDYRFEGQRGCRDPVLQVLPEPAARTSLDRTGAARRSRWNAAGTRLC